MLKESQLIDLADITGEDFFSSELYMRKLYSQDIASLPGIVNDIIGTLVDAVAQPVNAEVVSNLLKYCMKNKIPVIPRGHGTSGYGGALATKSGLAIEMTRMNEVYHIDREALTVEVGAGIIWGYLLEILEDEGFTLPTYPSSAPSSTVGGWVAAGGTGIGSTKYGGIRDQVVDLEVVLPMEKLLEQVKHLTNSSIRFRRTSMSILEVHHIIGLQKMMLNFRISLLFLLIAMELWVLLQK